MQIVEINDEQRAEIEAELDRDMRHGKSVKVGDVTIWLCGNVTLPLRGMAGQEKIPCYRCGWTEWQYSTRVEKAAGWKLHCLYCDTPRDPDDLYRFAPKEPTAKRAALGILDALQFAGADAGLDSALRVALALLDSDGAELVLAALKGKS